MHLQLRISLVMSQIGPAATGEVVEHDHVSAILQEAIHQVAPDKPRASRDDDFHVCLLQPSAS